MEPMKKSQKHRLGFVAVWNFFMNRRTADEQTLKISQLFIESKTYHDRGQKSYACMILQKFLSIKAFSMTGFLDLE